MGCGGVGWCGLAWNAGLLVCLLAYGRGWCTVWFMQTGSSTVRCGYPMRHWRDQPEGWDMGNATPDGHVTCPGCISR